MLKRYLRRTVYVVLAVCVILLTGCTPYSRGYVISDDGSYRLEIVPGCATTFFQQVVVKYVSEEMDKGIDDLETVWSVTFDDGSSIQSVTLFGPVPDAIDEFTADNIDLSRAVVVWWAEDDGLEGSVAGALSDMEPGFVLWDEGYESAEEFVDNVPRRMFGC